MGDRPTISSLFAISIAAALVAAPGHPKQSAAAPEGIERSTVPSGIPSGWWADVMGCWPAQVGGPEVRLAGSPHAQRVPIDLVPSRADWIGEADKSCSYFGNSVGTAGDVNGDGFDDVIVGAPYYTNGLAQEGKAFVYHGSASGLALTPAWTFESNGRYAYFGYSAGTAGDVNGDGFDDVIVGAWAYTNDQTEEGGAFVYHGSAAGLSLTPSWTAESDQVGAGFGYSVGTAGDVNADGFDEVIVGAYFYTHNQDLEGRAFVYQGSASGLSLTPSWTAESNWYHAFFGTSVGTAGDVNSDGFDDVIVGADGYSKGQTDEGRAFVYHGSASGLSLTPSWTAEGDQEDANFGHSVGTAGDVNGDGFDDVIVGADDYDKGHTGEGVAFAYHGSASGLSLTPSWIAESDQAGAAFGGSVGTAGDVNGDGFDDVIVGAVSWGDEGRVFVYRGSPSGLRHRAWRTPEGDQEGTLFGYSVGTAGDVNADGFHEVIVGAPEGGSQYWAGEALAWYGG